MPLSDEYWGLLRLLRSHLGRYRGSIAAVVALQLIQTSAAVLYLPALNSDIVDTGIARGDNDYIWRLILVMDGGRIVEQGTHDQLLAAGGAYWTLYHAQFAAPAAEVA